MTQREPKVAGIIIHLPIDLAIEIFRESGDLSISEFPAIVKFADYVAETLNMEQDEMGTYAEPIVMSENEEKIPASTKRDFDARKKR